MLRGGGSALCATLQPHTPQWCVLFSSVVEIHCAKQEIVNPGATAPLFRAIARYEE